MGEAIGKIYVRTEYPPTSKDRMDDLIEHLVEAYRQSILGLDWMGEETKQRALEDALLDFAGCAVIISHDRWFLDRIATHILAFEGDSHVEWFEGNFADYEEDKKRRLGIDSTIPKRIQYKKFSR